MERIGELMIRHPAAVMITLAALMAASACQAYRIGFADGTARCQLAEQARAASEALGG